jgi:hypothetical protein
MMIVNAGGQVAAEGFHPSSYAIRISYPVPGELRERVTREKKS